MMPKTYGGSNLLRKRVSLLFAIVFLLAALRWFVGSWVSGLGVGAMLGDSRFWLVFLISLVFFAGLKFRRVRFVEPYIFLVIAIIPLAESPQAIYGFGLFAVGSIMLFVDGQLSKRPVLKFSLLAAYLLLLLVLSTFVTNSSIDVMIAMLLFVTAFFLFLFLTFQDKIIVFVKATKPVVRLSEKGLTEKEIDHLMGLMQGKSMKEIAWANHVKESTVRNSLSRAYHKLGFTDRVQVLQWAESYDVRP